MDDISRKNELGKSIGFNDKGELPINANRRQEILNQLLKETYGNKQLNTRHK